jgi:hypothetical protein
MSEMTNTKPAGRYSHAGVLRDSPYTILPDIDPDANMRAVLLLLQKLQKRKLKPEEDRALRALRDLPTRLSWDLLTLGTTPDVPLSRWKETEQLLSAEKSDDALHLWSESHPDPASLHVRAVLACNRAMQQYMAAGSADEQALCQFVAWWVALLWRRPWFEAFSRSRCVVWGENAPDIGDQAQFLDKAEKAVAGIFRKLAGTDEQRWERWSGLWNREQAALEVFAKASGRNSGPPAWPSGYGPLGLELLGAAPAAQEWIARMAAGPSWPLPITAVRSGDAGFFKLNPEQVTTAAEAVRWLFSSLGVPAAEVWRERGRSALSLLKQHSGDASNGGGFSERDLYFGTKTADQRRRLAAIGSLTVEALLLQVYDELSRREVPVEQVCETAGALLFQSGSLSQPQVAIQQLETLLCGRILACAEKRALPHPDEVQRIIDVSIEIRSILLGRGEGKRCGREIARLLNRRASVAWNRKGKRAPGPAAQQRILRDMFLAADLSPHSADIVANLGYLAMQIQTKSPAERESLLKRALDYVKICREHGTVSAELEECHSKLEEIVDPAAARARVLKQLEMAMSPRNLSREEKR